MDFTVSLMSKGDKCKKIILLKVKNFVRYKRSKHKMFHFESEKKCLFLFACKLKHRYVLLFAVTKKQKVDAKKLKNLE